MTAANDNVDTIEGERLKIVEGIDRPDDYGPGTMGAHAAYERTGMIMDIVGLYLLEHPTIALNREWYETVWTIHDALCDLYTDIGDGCA